MNNKGFEMAALKGYLREKEVTYSVVAGIAGLSVKAFSQRINGHLSFNVTELEKISEHLNFNAQDVERYFFAVTAKRKNRLKCADFY